MRNLLRLPGAGIVVTMLFSVTLALAQTQPAQSAANAAPNLDPPPQKMDEMRGDIAMAKKEYLDAATYYQKALQLEPRNASLLNKTGIAYHQLLKFAQAKRYYERAIKADKNYAFAVNNLGMIQYHKKKWNNAAKEFAHALQLRPEVAAVQSNYGHALFAMKKYDAAMEAFNRALVLDPQVFERRSGAGSVLQDRSVEDRPFYYFFLAKSFAGRGDAERCAQYLRKARDEGYKGIENIAKDPAFASVINDPLIQELIVQSQTVARQ